MAKRVTRRSTAAKKSAKSSAKAKPAPKKAPAKSPAKLVGMHPVNTGKGPSAFDVAKDIVAMFNRGEMKQIEDKYWSPDVASIEGMGVNLGWFGRKAVEAKNADWMSDHEIHGASAEGPYVGSSGFAIRFKMDVSTKSTGKREVMDEVGVYQLKDGKIVREEFMYGVG